MLKSNSKDLQRRGLASAEDIHSLKNLPVLELITLLHSGDSVTRTAAAYNLSPMYDLAVVQLLEQLSAEKSLYTKIAICEVLEKGGLDTARKMTAYLGKIGCNQHRILPEKISAKKSYPLPRDIIARSLGKMDTLVLPALLDVLQSGDEAKISEVLDALGFMAFCHKEVATEENAQAIYRVLRDFADNALIVWKSVVCLSAFPSPQSIVILQGFSAQKGLLGAEADRSLRLISTRQPL